MVNMNSKIPSIIFAIVIVSGISTALYLYNLDKDALVYYGDAVSHLVAARKLFDWSENPGWSQIGTVWLPLPHFLFMLPSLVDGLFFSGFAGTVVSLISTALTSVLVYMLTIRILQRMRFSNDEVPILAACSTALLYGLNPNTLYLGISAMTEAPFMLFFVGAAYYLLKWRDSSTKTSPVGCVRFLLISSLFISAATLSRYEGWLLPILLLPLSAVVIVRQVRRKNISHASPNDPRSERSGLSAIIATILAALLSVSGITFWLVYNSINYGDAFEFANAEYYSAASQAMNRSFREALFLQPASVFSVYGITAVMMYGPVVLAAGAVGYYLYRRVRRSWTGGLGFLYVFLVIPPMFTVTTLLAGIGEMAYWFNSRFALLLAPALLLSVSFYVSGLPNRISNDRRLLAGVIVSLFAFHAVVLPFSAIITMADALGGFSYKHSPYAVRIGEKVGELYDGSGSIMIVTGSAQEHRILLASGIPFRHFDTVIESSTWKASFREPWSHGIDMFVIAKDPDSDGVVVVDYWKEHRSELEARYQLVLEDEYYLLWTREG